MLTSGEPSFQTFKRSDVPAVAWSSSLRVRGSWPCLVSHLFLQGREAVQWELSLGAVRSGSLLPGSAFAVSCSPARQGVHSEEVVFYLEGKTWTQSEILAHLTAISSHRYVLFHGSRQKSAFPFDIDLEISRTPPACREVWFGAFTLLPFIDWLVVFVRSFLSEAFKCALDFWTLNSTGWIYSHCVKGAWAVTALNAN